MAPPTPPYQVSRKNIAQNVLCNLLIGYSRIGRSLHISTRKEKLSSFVTEFDREMYMISINEVKLQKKSLSYT